MYLLMQQAPAFKSEVTASEQVMCRALARSVIISQHVNHPEGNKETLTQTFFFLVGFVG